MAIQKTEKIWHNGKLIAWDDATIHVMSHVVHYGSSVFEGIRCYALPSGPAIFRATEHMQRLLDSARIYRIDVPFTRDEILRAMVELVGHNGVCLLYTSSCRNRSVLGTEDCLPGGPAHSAPPETSDRFPRPFRSPDPGPQSCGAGQSQSHERRCCGG